MINDFDRIYKSLLGLKRSLSVVSWYEPSLDRPLEKTLREQKVTPALRQFEQFTDHIDTRELACELNRTLFPEPLKFSMSLQWLKSKLKKENIEPALVRLGKINTVTNELNPDAVDLLRLMFETVNSIIRCRGPFERYLQSGAVMQSDIPEVNANFLEKIKDRLEILVDTLREKIYNTLNGLYEEITNKGELVEEKIRQIVNALKSFFQEFDRNNQDELGCSVPKDLWIMTKKTS